MISLTRLNQASFVLNSDLIEYIEGTSDTVVALTTGAKYLVCESSEEIVCRIVAFRRSLAASLPAVIRQAPESSLAPLEENSRPSLVRP